MAARKRLEFTVYREGLLATFPPRVRGWRWRLVAANGNIIADGSEGYSTSSHALRAVRNRLRSFGVDVSGRDWQARIAKTLGVVIAMKEE
jgi:hypothetical protein